MGKETRLDFKSFDPEEYLKLLNPSDSKMSLYKHPMEYMEFNYFVHSKYGQMRHLGGTLMPFTSLSPTSLILEMSGSDEEAFESFFELYDEFRKLKDDLGDEFIKHYDGTLLES